MKINSGSETKSYVMSNYLDLYNAASVLIHVWEATQTGIGEHCINLFYNIIVPRWKAMGSKDPISMRQLVEDYEAKGLGKPARKTFYRWVKSLEEVGWCEPIMDPSDRRKKMVTVVKSDKNNSLLLALDKFKSQFVTDTLKEQILRLIKYSPPNSLVLKANINSPDIVVYENEELAENFSDIIQTIFDETYFEGLDRLEIKKEVIKELESSEETKRDNISNLPSNTLDRGMLRGTRSPDEQGYITLVVEAAQEVKKTGKQPTFPRIHVYQELKDHTGWTYERFASVLNLALADRVVFEDDRQKGYIGVIDDY